MYKYLMVEKLEQLYAELRVCSVCSGDNEHAYGEPEACQSAARAAENAHFLFHGDKPNDSEVRAICSPKRLGKQEK
jgi:hypothetical protein